MRSRILVALALTTAIVAIYAPVRDHAFVEWDDPLYVRDNPVVQQGLSLHNAAWAFTSDTAYLWHPLTWLSLMLDVDLYGAHRAGPFLLTNVALHAAATLALLALLVSLTGRLGPSAVATALFALHPLRVESVAWLSARKDGLAGLFALLSILAYVGWTRRGSAARYAGALALYALSLLAKPAHFGMPFLLLLVDAWPLGRLRRGGVPLARLALEKLPWLLLALAAAAINASMIRAAANPWGADLPLHLRVLSAPIAVLFYLEKTLWPTGLAIVYPWPHQMGLPFYGPGALAGGWAALAALSAGALAVRKRHPQVLWGWLWFLVALAPTLQLLPSGLRVPHDRYTYLPSIGLFVALAFTGAAAWQRSRTWRAGVALATAAALSACAFLSARQVGVWRDSQTLFAHSLAVTKRNVIVHFARGVMLGRTGHSDAAIADFRAALAVSPRHADSLNGLGYMLFRRGAYDEAIGYLRRAIEARPDYALAMANLGNTLDAAGQGDEALSWLRRAVEVAPDSANDHYWLGMALERRGQREQAAAQFRRALEIDPSHVWSQRQLRALEHRG